MAPPLETKDLLRLISPFRTLAGSDKITKRNAYSSSDPKEQAFT